MQRDEEPGEGAAKKVGEIQREGQWKNRKTAFKIEKKREAQRTNQPNSNRMLINKNQAFLIIILEIIDRFNTFH